MRHGKKFNHLGRKKAHRKAMLSNMAVSLIMHKRIKTTVAKAKALRVYVEPLITKSKDDTTHSRRVVFSYLQDKFAVSELFREISPKVADRPGGYTRILKTGNRLGDNAEMCIIELVDYNDNMLKEKKAKTKTRRRRGSGKKKTTEPAVAQTTPKPEETVTEEPKAKQENQDEKQEDTPVDNTKTENKTEEKEKTETTDKTKQEETVKQENTKEEPKAKKEEQKTENNKDNTENKEEEK